jgi:hypothetical protein
MILPLWSILLPLLSVLHPTDSMTTEFKAQAKKLLLKRLHTTALSTMGCDGAGARVSTPGLWCSRQPFFGRKGGIERGLERLRADRRARAAVAGALCNQLHRIGATCTVGGAQHHVLMIQACRAKFAQNHDAVRRLHYLTLRARPHRVTRHRQALAVASKGSHGRRGTRQPPQRCDGPLDSRKGNKAAVAAVVLGRINGWRTCATCSRISRRARLSPKGIEPTARRGLQVLPTPCVALA